MLRKTALFIIASAISTFAFSQFDPYGGLAMYNLMYYNPGYAGDGNEIESRVLGQNNLMGFGEGAPTTQFFNVDAPFKLFNQRHGAGLSIMNDIIGASRNVGVNLSYAYRRSLIQGDLGFGIGLNLTNSTYNDASWIMSENSVLSGVGSDPSIPGTSEAPMALDFNLGVYYKSDNLFLSISGRNLGNAKMNFKEEYKEGSFIGRQIYFSSGYEYQLPNPMFSIKPVVFVGTDFSGTQLNLTNFVTYNKRFFGGTGVKFSNSISEVSVIAGIDLPSGIEVAICYDINTTRLTNFSNGSFEFMAGYSFSLEIDKDNRKYKSVRFL